MIQNGTLRQKYDLMRELCLILATRCHFVDALT